VIGILASSAAGANTLIVPFVGMLSDHTRGPFVRAPLGLLLLANAYSLRGLLADHYYDPLRCLCDAQGKRKPYILVSAILACAGLLWLPHTTGLPDLVASYLLLGIGIAPHFLF
jgi:hypothetical protein